MKTPPKRVEVWGAAKVNIGWRVGSKRSDGFHDVCGLLHTISLTDRLLIETDDGGDATLLVEVPGHPQLEGSSNIVARAAEALADRADARPTRTRIVIHKSIPVAAGLGGGSADAAAALIGLNTAWGSGRTARQLIAIGAEVGSDVPGILLGGLVAVSGRGENVRSAGAADAGWFVLGVGEEGVSAADAYDRLDARPRSLTGSRLDHNDLEAAACSLVDGLAGRLDAMRRAAGVAFVAGSGPTVVGVTADEAHARDVAARMRPNFVDVLLAQPINWGVRMKVGQKARN